MRAHGFVVEPVKDGREVLDKARSFVPNLIVMDIQLPHVSGLELIEQIKKDPQLKIIPIMAVTAYAGKGDEDRILTAGAEAYVSKPISVAKFIESVQKGVAPLSTIKSELFDLRFFEIHMLARNRIIFPHHHFFGQIARIFLGYVEKAGVFGADEFDLYSG